MVTRLHVTYRNMDIDEDLEKKILKFFNLLSFVCVNRDHSQMTFRRVLTFEKRTKEIEYGSSRSQEVKLTA